VFGSLVQELDDLCVELVDGFAMLRDIHRPKWLDSGVMVPGW
jgi:hypothetical protein